MKTIYDTYQEAKIANPTSDIYVLSRKTALMVGKFQAIDEAPTSHFSNSWTLCKPADFCITLDKFLESGKSLTKGDFIIEDNGSPLQISTDSEMGIYNEPDEGDVDIYILRAAALQAPEQESTAALESTAKKFRSEMEKLLDSDIAELQNKQRTKVEYVHLTESNFNVWDLKDLLFNDELFSRTSSDNYIPYIGAPSVRMINDFSKFGVYRKVERPIEWWEDMSDYLSKYDSVTVVKENGGYVSLDIAGNRLSMTRDQWCDFARILLEQEGE